MGQIGKPQREIYVEPLEIPVPTRQPVQAPATAPSQKPVEVPA